MANNEFKTWDIRATWELNHEKGIAKFSLLNADTHETIESLQYVQGNYFTKDGKLVSKETGEAMLWLMKKLNGNLK
jgi:hypothetical protein